MVLTGLVVFFAVSAFGYPYGRIRSASGGSVVPSTYLEDPSGAPRRKPAGGSDTAAAPGLALYPPALLVKAVADMALLSATDSDPGLAWASAQVPPRPSPPTPGHLTPAHAPPIPQSGDSEVAAGLRG